MSKWLHSGLRRDVCAVVFSLDRPTAQRAKSTLERRYDERIEPRTFYGALSALVEAGFLARTTEGIHDRYELTDAGERGLRTHHAWVAECLSSGADGGLSDDGTEAE
ncbi:MAG: PadR family transcriptional regulator [Salinigranum sp.]